MLSFPKIPWNQESKYYKVRRSNDKEIGKETKRVGNSIGNFETSGGLKHRVKGKGTGR